MIDKRILIGGGVALVVIIAITIGVYYYINNKEVAKLEADSENAQNDEPIVGVKSTSALEGYSEITNKKYNTCLARGVNYGTTKACGSKSADSRWKYQNKLLTTGDGYCLDASLKLTNVCDPKNKNLLWTKTPSGQLKNDRIKKCLVNTGDGKVKFTSCNNSKDDQIWEFK